MNGAGFLPGRAPVLLGDMRGRDNNFNLIRIAAALTVLFAHSINLLGLDPPGWRPPLFIKSSVAAVDVFFFISGFLVTGSLLSRANIFEYAWARLLRIFPGLWVMLAITVTTIGFFFTTLPPSEFFASPVTHDYLLRCATLVNGLRFNLPGVFEHNPLGSGVNGSLWSLPIEWRLYEYLAAAWVLLALKPDWRPQLFRWATLVAAIVLSIIAVTKTEMLGWRENVEAPMALFFYGATMRLWRDRIRLSPVRFAALVAALALAAVNRHLFLVVYTLVLGPIVLHVAFLIGGPIRRYNRLGDYSYGVYIYAFPIQQALIAAIPGLTLAGLNVAATVLTLACAIASWHLVEKPALDWKLVPAAATEQLFLRLSGFFGALRKSREA